MEAATDSVHPGRGARRYARAIFELARADGQAEEWPHRLRAVEELFNQPEVQAVLANPSIARQRRQDAVAGLLSGRADQQSVNLAKLLVAANRVGEVAAISQEFERLEDEAQGRLRATVTSAVELNEDEHSALQRQLTARFGREVRLRTRVRPEVMGGLVIQAGDQVIDASVASRLQQLRRSLAGSEESKR